MSTSSVSSQPEKPPYAEYHRARLAFLLGVIRKFVPHNTAHILEVGRGPFNPISHALDMLTDWTIPSLRRGQTVVFKKPAADV